MSAPSISTAELPGLIAAVAAVGGDALGGLVLQGPASPSRTNWLALFRELSGAQSIYTKIPVNVSDDRLLGGLDLAATLSSGQLVRARGLLAESHGGVIEVCMAERQSTAVVSALCGVLDDHHVRVERDGIASVEPARLAVIAIDESIGEDESIDRRLRDRLGLTWTLNADGNEGYFSPYDDTDCAAARQRLPEVVVPDFVYGKLTAVSDALLIDSPRPVLQAVCVARVLAALDERTEATEADMGTAALLALAMRIPGAMSAFQEPSEAQPEEASPPPPSEAESQSDPAEESQSQASDAEGERQDESESVSQDGVEDSIEEAAKAVLPEQLLSTLAALAMRSKRKKTAGKSGEAARSSMRGRPLSPVPGEPVGGKRLDILATLKSAAPMQRLREARSDSKAAFSVRKDDLRIRRHQRKTKTTTIFVVDASGSAAVQRLAETKGAIEILLGECYVRRDQVALVAFRQEAAELLLPATRSLVRAKRTLGTMAGGGATPLASGLQLAMAEAIGAQKRGELPQLVLMTDARANIGLGGERDPAFADKQAQAVAREISELGVPVLCIDTGRRPGRRAQQLAESLDGRYLPLPFADAATVSSAVQQVL